MIYPGQKPLLRFKYLRLQYSRESKCMGIEHHGSRPSVPSFVCLWCAPRAESIHVMLSTASSCVFYVTIYVPCWICILLFNRIYIYSARSTIQIWRITLIVKQKAFAFYLLKQTFVIFFLNISSLLMSPVWFLRPFPENVTIKTCVVVRCFLFFLPLSIRNKKEHVFGFCNVTSVQNVVWGRKVHSLHCFGGFSTSCVDIASHC